MTMNFSEISEELAKVKALINTFNLTRRNLWNFGDTIKNFNVGKPGSPHSFISANRYKKGSFSDRRRIYQLAKKGGEEIL